jgi:L-threonylcarbamoyladenylate synthase
MDNIDRALKNAGVVILPTETVYGLAARADTSSAIDKIYAIKGRAFNKPLALCIRDIKQAEVYGQFSPLAQELANHFWPGPLSLIVPTKFDAGLDTRVLGKGANGQKTISFRCPDANWRDELSLPLALTSANRSGEPETLSAKAAVSALGHEVEAVLDGPDCSVGLASTILTINGNTARVLRQGSLTPEDFAPFDIEWSL